MKLCVLGCAGWMPANDRQTSCYVIDSGKSLIILDHGTGIGRLDRYTELLDKYKEVNIILSHYHFDHLMGFCYVLAWARNKTVNIFGPGKKLLEKTCEDTILSLFSPPHFMPFDYISNAIHFFNYDLEGFKIGDLSIDITEQIHTGKSFGITVGNFLHYATDTALNRATFVKAKNVELLLHDCWSIENENSQDHSALLDIIEWQKEFKVNKIGLIHINPMWTKETFDEADRLLSTQNEIFITHDKFEFSSSLVDR